MKNTGGPAFPRPYSRDDWSGDRPESLYAQDGMSLRAYIATAAMQGILAWSPPQHGRGDLPPAGPLAEGCVIYADALIAELSK